MTQAGEPAPGKGGVKLDALVEHLDSAGRAQNKVLVRWLLDADVPLFAACVLFTLDPEDAPMSVREIAETIGISADDAARAVHELRSLGYCREDKRRYEPTEEGLRLHASLQATRRDALAAFLSGLDEEGRRDLAAAIANPWR